MTSADTAPSADQPVSVSTSALFSCAGLFAVTSVPTCNVTELPSAADPDDWASADQGARRTLAGTACSLFD